MRVSSPTVPYLHFDEAAQPIFGERGRHGSSGGRVPPDFLTRNRHRNAAMLKGFGRRPFAGARAGRGAGVRKPRKEETAGRRGAVWLGATYGDLMVADGSPMWRRGRKAAGVIVGSEHDGLFRRRGCERRVWARRLERVCGGREDMVVLLRRAAGGEAKRRCVAGSGDGHEESILMRVGDGDRSGRAPWKVSTMIIRPPQQGHGREGEGVSASLSVSAGAGETLGAASKWRARSMLRARTAPAKRP